LGAPRFLLFYLLCCIGGGVAHILWDPHSIAVLIGASGGVAGVVAAYLILHPSVRIWVLVLGKVPARLPAWIVLSAWIVFQLVYALIQGDIAVAWWAHVGGIVVGAILVLLLRKPGVRLLDKGLAPATSPTAPTP